MVNLNLRNVSYRHMDKVTAYILIVTLQEDCQ